MRKLIGKVTLLAAVLMAAFCLNVAPASADGDCIPQYENHYGYCVMN